MTTEERNAQTARIIEKLAAMTPEQLREFAEFVKEEHPDIFKVLFADVYDNSTET